MNKQIIVYEHKEDPTQKYSGFIFNILCYWNNSDTKSLGYFIPLIRNSMKYKLNQWL